MFYIQIYHIFLYKFINCWAPKQFPLLSYHDIAMCVKSILAGWVNWLHLLWVPKEEYRNSISRFFLEISIIIVTAQTHVSYQHLSSFFSTTHSQAFVNFRVLEYHASWVALKLCLSVK